MAFHGSSFSEHPKHPTALNATFKRVRVPARVNVHPVLYIAIDTANDVQCIAAKKNGQHPTLKTRKCPPFRRMRSIFAAQTDRN